MNIIIVGDKGVGKTTLIKRVTKDIKCSGFLTFSVLKNGERVGVNMRDLSDKYESKIAYFDENNQIIPITKNFETVGTRIIDESICDTNSDIIIFDELFF